MGNVLFMRKGETHSKPIAGLPAGYTELTYIQCSGTQYINTDYYPKHNTKLIMDISDVVSGSWKSFYGVRTNASATCPNQFALSLVSATSLRNDYFGSNSSATISVDNSRQTIVHDKNICTAFGATMTATSVSSGQATLPLALFAYNQSGTVACFASLKCYSCQIYEGNTLVRDFVPCINAAGEIGLYDRVGKKFYGNAGTGVFIGSEVAA